MITQSDYVADNSLDCPHCNVPIEEKDLQWLEPDIGDHKMTCPHCSKKLAVATAERPVSSGDFTVCLSCREIIRFDDQLQLVQLTDQDWSELARQKALLTAMLQWRMYLLGRRLNKGECDVSSI